MIQETESIACIASFTNRPSVTRLRNKFNPKNTAPVWTQDRFQKEINESEYHDKKKYMIFLIY